MRNSYYLRKCGNLVKNSSSKCDVKCLIVYMVLVCFWNACVAIADTAWNATSIYVPMCWNYRLPQNLTSGMPATLTRVQLWRHTWGPYGRQVVKSFQCEHHLR